MQVDKNSPVEQTPLPWIEEAFSLIGTKEIKGPKHNEVIIQMLKELNLPWLDDETPWCAVFVSALLKRSGRGYPKKSPAWAKSYATNGKRLTKPAYGCVACKSRKGGGGHVFFVVGITENGKIVGLGGNQSDSVNLTLFNHEELTYTWPPAADGTALGPLAARYKLPVYNSKTLKLSVKED